MKEIMYSDLMSIKIGASGAEQSHVDGLIGISQGTPDLGGERFWDREEASSIISSRSRAGHQTARDGRGPRSLAVLLAGFAGTFLANRLAAQLDAIGIVNQPVHDAVGNAGIANLFVPVRNRHLTGENGGTTLVTVIADLEEIAAFSVLQRRHGEVIQYEHVDARKLHQQLADAAVGPGYRQFAKELGHCFVQCEEAITAGPVRQRAG